MSKNKLTTFDHFYDEADKANSLLERGYYGYGRHWGGTRMSSNYHALPDKPSDKELAARKRYESGMANGKVIIDYFIAGWGRWLDANVVNGAESGDNAAAIYGREDASTYVSSSKDGYLALFAKVETKERDGSKVECAVVINDYYRAEAKCNWATKKQRIVERADKNITSLEKGVGGKPDGTPPEEGTGRYQVWLANKALKDFVGKIDSVNALALNRNSESSGAKPVLSLKWIGGGWERWHKTQTDEWDFNKICCEARDKLEARADELCGKGGAFWSQIEKAVEEAELDQKVQASLNRLSNEIEEFTVRIPGLGPEPENAFAGEYGRFKVEDWRRGYFSMFRDGEPVYQFIKGAHDKTATFEEPDDVELLRKVDLTLTLRIGKRPQDHRTYCRDKRYPLPHAGNTEWNGCIEGFEVRNVTLKGEDLADSLGDQRSMNHKVSVILNELLDAAHDILIELWRQKRAARKERDDKEAQRKAEIARKRVILTKMKDDAEHGRDVVGADEVIQWFNKACDAIYAEGRSWAGVQDGSDGLAMAMMHDSYAKAYAEIFDGIGLDWCILKPDGTEYVKYEDGVSDLDRCISSAVYAHTGHTFHAMAKENGEWKLYPAPKGQSEEEPAENEQK